MNNHTVQPCDQTASASQSVEQKPRYATKRMEPHVEAKRINSDNRRNSLIYWGGTGAAAWTELSEPGLLEPRQRVAMPINTDNPHKSLIYWGGTGAAQERRSAT